MALEHLDAMIELIRASRDREAAREQLIERFELSVIQATAILDLRLSQLTALEADGINRSTPTCSSGSPSCGRSSATNPGCSA